MVDFIIMNESKEMLKRIMRQSMDIYTKDNKYRERGLKCD